MPIAAKVTACWPEPQKRFSVTPGASTGQPAASTLIRPMQPPWSPAGLPLPTMTSSTSLVSMPVRAASALSTWASTSWGWMWFGEQFAHDGVDLVRIDRWVVDVRLAVPALGDAEDVPGGLDDLAGDVRRL